MGIDPVVMIALSLMLSFVVVDAGLHKLRNPLHYAAVIDDYRVLPRGSGSVAVWIAGAVEMGAGIAILLPSLNRAGLALTGLLLMVYFAVMAQAGVFVNIGLMALNLLRGRREIYCGCGARERAQGLSAGLLVRNAALALAALMSSVAQPLARGIGWFDWLVAIAAALAAILIYLSASLLLSNNHLLVRLK